MSSWVICVLLYLSDTDTLKTHLQQFTKTVVNWYKTSGFTGLFNTTDHGAITLVI